MLGRHFALAAAAGDNLVQIAATQLQPFSETQVAASCRCSDSPGDVALPSTGLQWGQFCIVLALVQRTLKPARPAQPVVAELSASGDALRSLVL